MKKLVLLFSLILFTSTLSFSQESTTYKQTLKKLMDVTGSQESYKAIINQMIATFKVQKPEVPEKIWNEFGDFFIKSATEDMLNLLLPVYQKHLTEDDLIAAIAFYDSSSGRKFAAKTPLIIKESMQLGQEWGRKLAEDFVKKLNEKGY